MTTYKPMISIAMATYNGEKYLCEQLDSILAQTCSVDEIVIVDDASSDNTLAILNEYQQSYKNIKIFPNNVNLGVIKSFEKAIGLCSGDYIALADQDDVWFPNKIADLLAQIGDNLLIHSDDVLVDENLKVIELSHFAWGKQSNKSTFFDYLVNVNVTGCTVMFSRELINLALPFKSYSLPHDWYLTYYAAYLSRIKLYLQPLLYYRQHEINVSGARKKTFAQYLKNCSEVSAGLNDLLVDNLFQQNIDLILMRNYKQGIVKRNLLSIKDVFQLLQKGKVGLKLLAFYYLMTLPSLSFSEKIYNVIRKYI